MNQLPDVTLTIEDGGLGLLPTASDQVVAIVGPALSGSVGAVISITSYDALLTTFGGGALVDAAAVCISMGAPQVLCVRSEGTLDGTTTVTGPGAGLVTIQGQATRDADIAITVTAGRVSISREGRPAVAAGNVGTVIALADLGVTLIVAFQGQVDYDTTISFRLPKSHTGSIVNGIRSLLQDPREWGAVLVTGFDQPELYSQDPAVLAAAFDFAVVAGQLMDEASASHRYASVILPAPVSQRGPDALAVATQAFAHPRVMVAHGTAVIVHPINLQPATIPLAVVVAAKFVAAPISHDFGRVASGSLPGVLSISHDERQEPGLDAARFSTARTFIGLPGFYLTAGRMFAASGSDYEFVQHRRVMDRACKLSRAALLPYLNDSVRVDTKTGGIDEGDARDVETSLEASLDADLVGAGHATRAKGRVIRTDAIIQTKTMRVSLNIIPKGYLRAIGITLSFINPALATATSD